MTNDLESYIQFYSTAVKLFDEGKTHGCETTTTTTKWKYLLETNFKDRRTSFDIR